MGRGNMSIDIRNNHYLLCFFINQHCNEESKAADYYILISKFIMKHTENVAICSLLSSKSKNSAHPIKPKEVLFIMI